LRLGNTIKNKDMATFNTEHFNEGAFKKELQEHETIVERFTDAAINLDNEGIPTDYKFIMQLSKYSDNEYLEYIKKHFQEYIGKLGFVAKAERKRIAAVYDSIYTNTLPSVQTIRNSFSKGLILAENEDGSFRIDRNKMKAEAKKRATNKIDAEAMQEYFGLIMNIRDAMAKAGEFEEKHGLYKFSDGESKLIYLNPYYPDFLCELTLPKYFKEGNCNPKYFEKMMCHFFKQK
jgi:hypothetical protein